MAVVIVRKVLSYLKSSLQEESTTMQCGRPERNWKKTKLAEKDELAKQKELARQEKLARKAELTRQQKLARQAEFDKQRELAEQELDGSLARQAELAEEESAVLYQ